jgi:hypothetical protein
MPAAAAAAADSSAGAEVVEGLIDVVLLEDTTEGYPLPNIPDNCDEVGVADNSLCRIASGVLENTVGVVPFEAGEADVDVSLVLVLEAAAGVTVSTGATDVVAAAGGGIGEVVVSGSGVEAIEVVGAALDVELTETAT